jgi:hypothetical protein
MVFEIALLIAIFAVLTGPVLPGWFNRRVAQLPAAHDAALVFKPCGLTVAGARPQGKNPGPGTARLGGDREQPRHCASALGKREGGGTGLWKR